MLTEENLIELRPLLSGFIRRHYRGEDWEDQVQETLLTLWTSRDKYKEDGKLEAWAYRQARNRLSNVYRSKANKQWKQTGPYVGNVHDPIFCPYLEESMHSILEPYLSDRERNIMDMVFDGQTHKEIAKILKVHEVTVDADCNIIRLKYAVLESETRNAFVVRPWRKPSMQPSVWNN